MRAGVVDRTERPSRVRLAEVPEPRLAPQHVKLAVKAVSVDQLWGRAVEPSSIPGSIVSGEVLAVGEGVTRFHVGQRVMGLCRTGGLAERVVVPEAGVSALPDDIDHVTGTLSAIAVQATFVVSDLLDALPPEGGLVAVDDAGTAFGCVTATLLADAGVPTVGIVGHADAAEVATDAGFGATVLRRDDEPLTVSVLRSTGGSGVAGYLDHRARLTLEDAWRVLTNGGVLFRCDMMRTRLEPPSPQAGRRLSELGARWMEFDGTRVLASRLHEFDERRARVFDALRSGRFRVPRHPIPFDRVDTLPQAAVGLTGHVVVTL